MTRHIGCLAFFFLSACGVDDSDPSDTGPGSAAVQPGSKLGAVEETLATCSVPHGSGVQAVGPSYLGPCVATACEAGFYLAYGDCLPGTPCPSGSQLLYGRCEGGVSGEAPILVVPVRFSFRPNSTVRHIVPPLTVDEIGSAVAGANQRLHTMSYHRFHLAPLVTAPVTLAVSDAEFYTRHPDGSIDCHDWAHARAALALLSAGMDVSSYTNFAFVFPMVTINGDESCTSPAFGGGGWATGPNFDLPELFPIPGTVQVLSGINAHGLNDAFLHEALHNVGLSHANGYDCGDEPIAEDTATCTRMEYGGLNDAIGAGVMPASQANSRFKEYLGWMTVAEARTSGHYRLLPVEGARSALKVKRGKGEYLYLEQRTALYDGLPCGLTVNHYVHDPAWPYVVSTYQLDMTPADSMYDGYTLAPGESFTDPLSLVTIDVHDCTASGLSLSITWPGE